MSVRQQPGKTTRHRNASHKVGWDGAKKKRSVLRPTRPRLPTVNPPTTTFRISTQTTAVEDDIPRSKKKAMAKFLLRTSGVTNKYKYKSHRVASWNSATLPNAGTTNFPPAVPTGPPVWKTSACFGTSSDALKGKTAPLPGASPPREFYCITTRASKDSVSCADRFGKPYDGMPNSRRTT